MVIDSHLHVLKAENFDEVTEAQIGHRHPEDTPIEDLVGWLVDAGVHKAVVMGQDTTRMWNSSCGEDYVLECVNQYPDLFVPLAAVVEVIVPTLPPLTKLVAGEPTETATVPSEANVVLMLANALIFSSRLSRWSSSEA